MSMANNEFPLVFQQRWDDADIIDQEKFDNLAKDHGIWIKSGIGTLEGKKMEIEFKVFQNVDLYGYNLSFSTFKNVFFEHCRFSYSSFEESEFVHCIFDGGEIDNCAFTNSILMDNKFGLRIKNSKFLGSKQIGVDYSGEIAYCNFQRTQLENVEFGDCVLGDVDFTSSRMVNTEFWYSPTHGINMSGVKGNLNISPIEFMEQNFEKTEEGYIVYKTFYYTRRPPGYWTVEEGSIISENVNTNSFEDCGSGINVSTLEWIKKNRLKSPIWKCLIKWEWLVGVIVPYNTDGKIRASRVQLLEKL